MRVGIVMQAINLNIIVLKYIISYLCRLHVFLESFLCEKYPDQESLCYDWRCYLSEILE